MRNISFSKRTLHHVVIMFFFQGLLGEVLRCYVCALTQWSRSGGDDRLSAADEKDKAKSVLEEIIAHAKQVKYFSKNDATL